MAIRIKRNGKHAVIILPRDAVEPNHEMLVTFMWLGSRLFRNLDGIEEIEMVDDPDETK